MEPEANRDPTFERKPDSEIALTGATSPGVRRIEAISAHISRPHRVFLFVAVFVIAFVYNLDGVLRYTYQPNATNDFKTHSLLATITVLRAVIAAAAQPTAAKIADVFGRLELVIVSIVFYLIGTIVEATSYDVSSFSAGAVLYQIGYTAIILLVEVIVADVTSLRARLFFTFIPASPFIIITWVSGLISASVLTNSTWRWGIGMWAIIYPVSAIPLILALFLAHRSAKKKTNLADYKTPYQTLGASKLAISLFWQLDVVGIILLIGIFALILVPFTIAGGVSTQWQTPQVIAPLVVGFCCIPAWVFWERWCPHPMVPFKLLKNRGVWAALCLAIAYQTAFYLQGDYLYTVLVVGFDETIESATRITSLFSFVSVVTGLIVGIAVFYVRRLKPFILVGSALYMVAFGLLIHFRGGVDYSSHSGVIGAQVLLGLAGGLFPYSTQASIQAATRHEHVAVITGLYLACYNIGGAIGNTISGAIWTQYLPSELNRLLGDPTVAVSVYSEPLTWEPANPVGTPARDAVMEAYRNAQRILTITGICLCVPVIGFALLLRDPRLTDTQSLPNAERTDAPTREDTHSNSSNNEEKIQT